jgi:hypothetical protein
VTAAARVGGLRAVLSLDVEQLDLRQLKPSD